MPDPAIPGAPYTPAIHSIGVSDIEAAADRIRSSINTTPLLESQALNAMSQARIFVKAKCLQKTGSFKFRGACNRAMLFSAEERERGIVAWSSGNHAQAVAAVGRQFNMPVTILMPEDAPKSKVDGARNLGATIRFYNRREDDREAMGAEIAQQSGAVIVPPFEDLRIMAGQGTVGLEIVEQMRAMDVEPDVVLAACSGGGLIAGIAVAVKARSPRTAVYATEPVGYDDLSQSLAAGRVVSNSDQPGSICDSLLVPRTGDLTFAVNSRLLAGSIAVTDDEVRRAMRAAFMHLKIVVEPGGATPLAAVLSGKLDVKGKVVAVVASGGNVDIDVFKSALDAEHVREHSHA